MATMANNFQVTYSGQQLPMFILQSSPLTRRCTFGLLSSLFLFQSNTDALFVLEHRMLVNT